MKVVNKYIGVEVNIKSIKDNFIALLSYMQKNVQHFHLLLSF